jgi:sugar phosphate permease
MCVCMYVCMYVYVCLYGVQAWCPQWLEKGAGLPEVELQITVSCFVGAEN